MNDSQAKASLSEKQGSSGKKKKPLDCSKYLTRYANAQECGSSHCIGMNYREHFHCLDCTSRIIVKKEEMIRHYKWHKKREDSLQHGFMRYSPFDDCTIKFGPCAHNQKQTHYHCIQSGCSKVYVSTSDVQMHANYHRKASAIIMEGFQRFRATEDCGTPTCDFYSQRTTHFHCRRNACNFTFKNKADMEKHKTYHQKDEILAKDGFKKYMKYEHCPYQGCAYSKLSNHIHCMRPGCNYVLHSTSQLYPHKRKHVKKETDPFANFAMGDGVSQVKQEMPLAGKPATAIAALTNIAESKPPPLTPAPSATMASDLLSTVARLSQGFMPSLTEQTTKDDSATPIKKEKSFPVNPFESISETASPVMTSQQELVSNDDEDPVSDTVSNQSTEQPFDKSLNLTPGRVLEPAAMNWKTEKSNRLTEQAKSMMGHFKIASGCGEPEFGPSPIAKVLSNASGEKQSELWKKYLTRYTANDPCNPRCWLLYKDHYHCNVEKCFNAFKNKDGVRDHARLHDNQEKISEQLFTEFSADGGCSVEGCQYNGKATHFHCKWMSCAKTITVDDDIFARLDHFQEHEFTARINQATRRNPVNVYGPFRSMNKKRGRPPKTSSAFPGMLAESNMTHHEPTTCNIQQPKDSTVSYSKFDEGVMCFDELCKFRREIHYHCNAPRCHTATNRIDVMHVHSINFHNYIQIPENYAYFDRNVNCRGVHCSNNRNSCHYHCLRPACEHSFIRHTTVAQHDKKHRDEVKPASTQHHTSSFASTSSHEIHHEPTEEELHVGGGHLNELKRLAEAGKPQQFGATPNRDFEAQQAIYNTLSAANKTVKASGTFFPQAGKPDESAAVDMPDESSNASSSGEEPIPEPNPSKAVPHLQAAAANLMQNSQATAMLSLLAQMTRLIQPRSLQQAQASAQQSPLYTQLQSQQMPPIAEESDTWQKMLGRMYSSPQIPCENVFCKKKQAEHYHCLECGTAFNKSHEAKLKAHFFKHSKYIHPSGNNPSGSNPSGNNPSGSKNLVEASSDVTPPFIPAQHNLAGLNNMLLEAMAGQQRMRKTGAVSGEASSTTRVGVPDSSTDELPAPSSSIQNMMMKALQLQVIGNGRPEASSDAAIDTQYMSQSDKEEIENDIDSSCDDEKATGKDAVYGKLSSCKDCGYPKCAHANKCEHYHCPRDGCSYGVTEQHRLIQHIKRHEKLDQVMGDGFKLFKPNNDCKRADCEFVTKVSHFHCQLCPYICTDANKILPHRKNHTNSSASTQQSNDIFTATDV
ncbi:zinc finger protein castor homolog 1-like [Watersipora subatra]|uniref:zinc finger protein castor homolog 1-like n=1 Tax=Watersipora subatra TaxID=2589382 RepID=UPI00355C3B62